VGCVFLCAAFVIIATKPRTRTGQTGDYIRSH